MKALITGASEGIGRVMAKKLSEMGYDVIIVARNDKKLEELKTELGGRADVYAMDLSNTENCYLLYEKVKDENIEIVINNAGFGVYGEFSESDLESEMNMVDLNIKTLHILTKLFIRDFIKKDSGYILNVASLAAFLPGPMHAGYYASKAYVLRLTQAVYEELRQKKSRVYIGAFCPGPVTTGFNKRAGAGFGSHGIDEVTAGNYAIEKMFKRKLIIMPSALLRAVRVGQKFLPEKLVLKLTYATQMKRTVERN